MIIIALCAVVSVSFLFTVIARANCEPETDEIILKEIEKSREKNANL